MKLVFKVVFIFFSCFLFNKFLVNGTDPEDDMYKYVETECNEEVDFHIVVDSSSSIGFENWKHTVAPLVKNIVNALDISKQNVHISLITFSNSFRVLIPYGSDASFNKEMAKKRIQNLENQFMTGGTYLHLPIHNVINKYIEHNMVRKTAAQMILILTDGVPNVKSSATDAVRYAQKLGAEVGILGIGRRIDRNYNRSLVGCDRIGECKLYVESAWKDVQKIMKPFLKTICREVEKEESCGKYVWGECSVTCGKGTRPGYRIPKHEGCKASTTRECLLPDCPAPEEKLTPSALPDTLPITVPENSPKTQPETPETQPEKSPETQPEKLPETPETQPEKSPETQPETLPGTEPNTVPAESEDSKTPEVIKEEPATETILPAQKPVLPPSSNTIRREPSPSSIVNPTSEQTIMNDDSKKIEENSNRLVNNVVEEEIKKVKNEPNNIDEEENIKESDSVPVIVPPFENRYYENEEANHEESNEEKKGTLGNNGFKIAGGLVGGIALIGAGFAGYKFFTASSAASTLHTEGVPFDDVAADGEKDFEENEQFRLPDENEWN